MAWLWLGYDCSHCIIKIQHHICKYLQMLSNIFGPQICNAKSDSGADADSDACTEFLAFEKEYVRSHSLAQIAMHLAIRIQTSDSSRGSQNCHLPSMTSVLMQLQSPCVHLPAARRSVLGQHSAALCSKVEDDADGIDGPRRRASKSNVIMVRSYVPIACRSNSSQNSVHRRNSSCAFLLRFRPLPPSPGRNAIVQLARVSSTQFLGNWTDKA